MIKTSGAVLILKKMLEPVGQKRSINNNNNNNLHYYKHEQLLNNIKHQVTGILHYGRVNYSVTVERGRLSMKKQLEWSE